DVLYQGAELGLLAFASADVADDGGDQQAGGSGQRAQADLDRDLGAVLAAARQLQAAAHRPDARGGEVAVALAGVGVAEAFGDEDLDGLAEQLLAAVAEEDLGLVVDQDD